MATRKAPNPAARPPGAIARAGSYLKRTSDARNSVLLVLPLFVLYQIGILATGGWRNGTDFVTGWLMRVLDGNTIAYLALNLAVLVAGAIYVWRQPVAHRLKGSTIAALLCECTLYSVIFAALVSTLLIRIGLRPALGPTGPGLTPLDAIVLSLGAGTYEELVFRVGVFAGGYRLLALFIKRLEVALAASLVLSSIIFSAIHYAPFGMDTFTLWSFMFRALLGMLFGVLFWWRGFAVAVYTHALYDIFILVPQSIGTDP